MINWFRRSKPKLLSDYERVYVIGDIHGRSDLLDRLVAEMQRDVAGVEGSRCLTVTLGDYVDRGPDSNGVLERLSRNPFPTPFIGLKGNHEDLFEGFLREPVSMGIQWRLLGAIPTLESYGVSVDAIMAGRNFEQTAEAFRTKVPKEHLKFLSGLKLSLDLHPYFLCHAGIRPGLPFDQQTPQDLLWIRQRFLTSVVDHGKIVIHGHTPVSEPEVLPNRINIDTGAYATGRLTCLVLEGKQRRFLVAQ